VATDTLSSVDIAAIEAAAGVPLNKAIETAVRVESLADEIVNINTRDDAAAASRAAKRTKPPPTTNPSANPSAMAEPPVEAPPAERSISRCRSRQGSTFPDFTSK
jgi:hypothetical protein